MLKYLLFLFALNSFSRVIAQEGVLIQWEGDKAKHIIIDSTILKHYPGYRDSVSFFKTTLAGESVALLGSTAIVDHGLAFTPVWTFTPGASYHIYFDGRLIETFRIPETKGESASIRIYPSADSLPENLLKFYIVFSKPMMVGDSYRYIRLLDEMNDTIPDVLLEIKPELWNVDQTMLTVWIDPGRIKRELLLNKELGKPLMSNKRYTLFVSNEWKDADGIPVQAHAKSFTAVQPDRKKPDTKNWKLTTPRANSRDPLTLHFNEPMDYAIALRGLDIYFKGETVHGETYLINKESGLVFIPEDFWDKGVYTIRIQSYVEDLAGNNLGRLFDSDLHQNTSALEAENKVDRIDFKID